MKTTFMIILASLLLSGCATPISTTMRPTDYYSYLDTSVASAGQSLFSGDAAVLTDDAIANILQFKYKAPALSRVAIMSFGQEQYSAWSEDLSVASEAAKQNVIDRLISSPRIYDASFLPSILVPDIKTVPHLREAAARYQADLMLVYRSDCRSFQKYRLFGADKSRAYCSVQAVLLDIRKGLVPFTSVARQVFEAKKNENDLNFQETILKAQLKATNEALSQVSAEVVGFLAAN